MTHTQRLISNLSDITVSEHTRGESLYILTKHNYYKTITDGLRLCYINEDYTKARTLIQIQDDRVSIKATKLLTSYTKRYHNGIHSKKTSSKHTYGNSMATQGDNFGWLNAMNRANMMIELQELADNEGFNLRISRLRKILKRKARLSNHKKRVSKTNKVTKYNKRAPIQLPSKAISC